MIGGLFGSGTRAALLAACGVLALGAAKGEAADLGGNCCADLEERIAELEATTARKGNRKVSLTISGQVAKAVLFWDDGDEQNAYVVDNDFAQTRLRLQGKAKIVDGWEAGYHLELGFDNASSDGVDENDDNAQEPGSTAGATTGGVEIRQSKWYIKSKQLGSVTVGLGSGAQDDLYKWGNVGKAYSDAELHYNGQFSLRTPSAGANDTGIAGIRWDNLANNLDLSRTNNVRYDSPEIAGFVFSTSWGEDDIWDIALRYDQKFDNFHVKAGVAYTEDSDTNGSSFSRSGNRNGATSASVINPASAGNETKDFVASAGVSEKTTGLYVYGAGGVREIDDQAPGITDQAWYVYGQLGITRDIIPLGATNFHVDYGYYEDWGAGQSYNTFRVDTGATTATAFGTILNSEVQRYGFGVSQNFKNADLDLYAVFNYYQADLTTNTVNSVPVEDWYGVTTGARIQF